MRAASILLSAVLALAGAAEAPAVTFEKAAQGDASRCKFRLTGEIAEGDLARIRAGIGDTYGARGQNLTICLSSPGGNLAEAIRIAHFLLERRASTRIEPGQECLSACSIVFMAGTEVRTNLVYLGRSMATTSRLAFHAPRPPSVAGRVDTDQAYDAAVEAIGRQLLRLARHREMQWTFPLIKPELINEMMLTSYARWYEIDSIGKAAQYQIYLTDPPPAPALAINTTRNACHNALARIYDAETANRFFNIPLSGYATAKDGQDEIARGGVDGELHTLRVQYKFGRCHVIANPSGDLRVNVSHGANTHPVEFVPAWYTLPPDRALDPKGIEVPARDAFCAKPQTPTERTVCTFPELARFERLAQSFIRRARAKELPTTSGGDYPVADEKTWRAELAACGTDYICINNSYTALLAHTFNWGRQN